MDSCASLPIFVIYIFLSIYVIPYMLSVNYDFSVEWELVGYKKKVKYVAFIFPPSIECLSLAGNIYTQENSNNSVRLPMISGCKHEE